MCTWRMWRRRRCFPSPAFVPVVEFVDVLNVSKNNVVLVDETRRDVFRAARHFPQVCLRQKSITLLPKG